MTSSIMYNTASYIKYCLILSLWLFTAIQSQTLDSLSLDHKPGTYTSPLYLKVLSVYEGKLYYETNGSEPSRTSQLYKGIIRLTSPRQYTLRFLYENPLGDEKHFPPQSYRLTPPKGYSQNLPAPYPPAGIYDSILLITFDKLPKASIYFGLNDSVNLKEYLGQEIILKATTTIYYKAVYTRKLSTDLFKEHYEILLNPPQIRLASSQRKYNFEPKLKIIMEKANRAFYSLDPLAPMSAFIPISNFIFLKEGVHVLRLYAMNRADMKSEIFKARITVDATAPEVKYYVTPEKKLAYLSANETANIHYTLDATTPDRTSKLYKNPIVLPRDGVIPILFFAVDTMGNESEIIGFRASADVEPPTVKVSPGPGGYRKAPVLKFNCSEECIIRYSLDGSDPSRSGRSIRPSSPLEITREGAINLKYFAKDQAGNNSEKASIFYIIDSRPPEVKYRIIRRAAEHTYRLEFDTDEPAVIHYTINGRAPTIRSREFPPELTIEPGTQFQFIAVDTLGNTTSPVQIEEILKPRIVLTPAGGIYNTSQTLVMTGPPDGKIMYRYTLDGQVQGPDSFTVYQAPLYFRYSGIYTLSYKLSGLAGSSIQQEQTYIIDKVLPHVVPILKKGPADSLFYLIFETSEPAKIYYTLDGSEPTPLSAAYIGSAFHKEELRISIYRKGKQVLKFYAEDRANNASPLYELDLFSPHVTTQPPPGLYDKIISVQLKSQAGNIIRFGYDSLDLSLQSPVFNNPIVITSPTTLWFFATDVTGFSGARQRAVFNINYPPEAQFTTLSKKILAGQTAVLDASLSTDTESPQDKLLFRWDLDGDGKFDTPFTASVKIAHRFIRPGTYQITLQVKDEEDLMGTIKQPVKIYKSCPGDMVSVLTESHAYCIDKYEWAEDLKHSPKANINWAEAYMLCNDKGRRLCSSQEWQTACSGKWDHFFSYSNTYSPGACNTESPQPVTAANSSECVSSDGVYNLVGNLWEWVSDYKDNHYMIMGGSHIQAAAASCDLAFPSQIGDKSETVGFRCCR